MDGKKIRAWCLIQPRPHKLRVTGEDAVPHEIAIGPGDNWMRIGESVEALQPVLIEALNEKAELIRAIRPAEQEEEDERDSIPVLANDPESVRLVTFAKLIAEAYRHSTDVAFERLGQLFETMMAKTISLERTVDGLNRALVKQALDSAAGVDGAEGMSLEQMMMSQFMQGKASAAAAAAAAKANGSPGKAGPE